MATKGPVTKDFEKFLRKQNMNENTLDGKKELKEWKNNINLFYSTIEKYLHEYISTKKIILSKEKIELIEDGIGRYEVDKLILTMGKSEVIFTPIATLLICSKGRIDMSSFAGTVPFILTNQEHSNKREKKTAAWKWFLLKIDSYGINYIDITQESFLNALMQVVNA